MKSGGGEIVQVEGGHILRSTGRKDRHSKVYTAKGPRDRRVRLAAHTAIEFYDVQDRLGYDRPSKAVDWLMNKAKNAIDKLEELPPWNPMDTTTVINPSQNMNGLSLEQHQHYLFHQQSVMNYQNYSSGWVENNNHQDLCLSLQSLQDMNSSAHSTPAHDHPIRGMVGWDTGEMKPGPGNSFYPHNMPREPLQSSSFSPYARPWNPVSDHNNTLATQHLSSFRLPARIHGEDPSSASHN